MALLAILKLVGFATGAALHLYITWLIWKRRLGRGLCRNSRALIIGVSVRATKPDTITAPARVNANSRNSLPVFPGVNAMGA